MISEIFQLEFMLRAIYAGLLVSLSCGVLGVFVVLRKQAFIADGVAHASLAGIAIGLLLGSNPILWAIAVAIVMSILLTYIKQNSNVSFDSSIGILYSFFFAVGILVISAIDSYKPDLLSFLFGSLLSITWIEVVYALALLIFVAIFIAVTYSKIVYMTFDIEGARVRGVNVKLLEYVLNILVSIAVIVSIKLMGVVLVTAMLVIPATFAKLFAKNFSQVIWFSCIYAIIATTLGIILSYILDLPSGAMVVVLHTVLLGFLVLMKAIRGR
ncbi:MAG: metal ABC transporter permease [bacterium]|nr:metal ABC transporter permease [bacterium]